MGCRSDYQEPTAIEIENSKVLALLKELKTGKLPDNFGTGSGDAYNKSSKEIVDKNTEALCTALQGLSDTEIQSHSLELQIWWRDHKKADEKRLKAEVKAIKDEKAKNKAVAKLTPHERKLLGIK